VERLADVLLVLRQDSLAGHLAAVGDATGARFAVDEEGSPPRRPARARAARVFVDATPQTDSSSHTEFRWPAKFRVAEPGTVRLSAASIPITARIGADQFLRGGESRTLPREYEVVVSPRLPAHRLAIELLPGVETLVRCPSFPKRGLLYVSARPWVHVIDGSGSASPA